MNDGVAHTCVCNWQCTACCHMSPIFAIIHVHITCIFSLTSFQIYIFDKMLNLVTNLDCCVWIFMYYVVILYAVERQIGKLLCCL